ncbi:MAG: hypothetical protein RMJ14_00885 [Nitrososphaerota archaeon]|nr:hypothetical protein [Aigarchaeota archaeon]MDW8076182.1 hypothetical protein [Nitrososphaerota archaeon]
MEDPKETIVQVDISVDGIPIATRMASSGYNVMFVTTSDYVASQLKEYRPSLHRIPKPIFSKLLVEGMLTATTDLENALASSKTILVTTHALRSEEEINALINLFKQIAPYILPNSLLIYCGLAPPGTMEEIISTLDKYSQLDVKKDINVILTTPFCVQTETCIICSPNFEAANTVKRFISTFVPSNAIKLCNTFREAEVANLLLVARRAIIRALSSYALLMFKHLDVNIKDALNLSEYKAATVIEDDTISEMVINYLISEERRLPQRLTFMRNIVRMRKMLLEAISATLKQEIKLASRKSKDLKIACVFERDSDKELMNLILQKKGVNVHFYTVDEIETKVNAGVERVIPFSANLIILAARLQSISERTIRKLEEEAKLINLGCIFSI